MPRKSAAKKAVFPAAKKARAKPAKKASVSAAKPEKPGDRSELVILTGMSGSGKASALKAFEDLGYYSVDNLPLELIPRFADLVRQSTEIERGRARGRCSGGKPAGTAFPPS